MQIATTFFNNEKYYLDNFVLWYTKLWNIKKFIFFIGNENLTTFNFKFNNIPFLVEDKSNILYYNYRSKPYNNRDEWHFLKSNFYDIIKNIHQSQTLWVDCDEFIFSKNINKVLNEGYFKTHFCEYVPQIPFNLKEEMV